MIAKTRRAKVISVAHEKGGVGKTTVAINLAAILRNEDCRVLIIDCDPQAHATRSMGLCNLGEDSKTVSEVFIAALNKQTIQPEDYIKAKNKMYIIPSDRSLAGVEHITSSNNADLDFVLADLIESLKNEYDYIILDCMPSFSIITKNAFVASDYVLIVTQAQYLSESTLDNIISNARAVKARLNKELSIAGIAINMYDGRTLGARESVDHIKTKYSDFVKIYSTLIPYSVKVSDATKKGVPVVDYVPSHKVSIAFKRLGEEFLDGIR